MEKDPFQRNLVVFKKNFQWSQKFILSRGAETRLRPRPMINFRDRDQDQPSLVQVPALGNHYLSLYFLILKRSIAITFSRCNGGRIYGGNF